MLSPNSKFICLLCGIPGSGKSFISEKLLFYLQNKGLNCLIVNYDENLKEIGEWNSETFKISRQVSFEKLKAAVYCSNVNFIIVDDLMYLHSMRREIYCIAREAEVPLLCIHVKTPLENALNRNNLRIGKSKIDSDVIVKISNHFEPLKKCTAEKYSLEVLNDGVLSVDHIVEQINDKINETLDIYKCQSFRDDKILANENSFSFPQELDLKMRKKVNQIVTDIKAKGLFSSEFFSKLKNLRGESLKTFKANLSKLNSDDYNIKMQLLIFFNTDFESKVESLVKILE